MGLFSEDFLNRAQSIGEDVAIASIGSIAGGVANTVNESLIRVGVKRANLSPAEVAAGEMGSREELRAPTAGSASGLVRALGDRSIQLGGWSLSPLMLAGGAVVAYFAFKTLKRGR